MTAQPNAVFHFPVRVHCGDTDAAGVVYYGNEVLVEGRVTLACLDRQTWRPARMPASLAARLGVAA